MVKYLLFPTEKISSPNFTACHAQCRPNVMRASKLSNHYVSQLAELAPVCAIYWPTHSDRRRTNYTHVTSRQTRQQSVDQALMNSKLKQMFQIRPVCLRMTQQ